MITSANFLPMCLLIGLLRLVTIHLPSMLRKQWLFFVLFKYESSFSWPLASMCVQSRFASLRPCSIIIALNRRGFPIVVVYENIASDGSSTDSTLYKVSVLLSWTRSTVDVFLSASHSKKRAIVIIVL